MQVCGDSGRRERSSPAAQDLKTWPWPHQRCGSAKTLIQSSRSRRCAATGPDGPAPGRAGPRAVRATLNKSLAARSTPLWAPCGVANPHHSRAMAAVCALQCIPYRGTSHPRGLVQHCLRSRRPIHGRRGGPATTASHVHNWRRHHPCDRGQRYENPNRLCASSWAGVLATTR